MASAAPGGAPAALIERLSLPGPEVDRLPRAIQLPGWAAGATRLKSMRGRQKRPMEPITTSSLSKGRGPAGGLPADSPAGPGDEVPPGLDVCFAPQRTHPETGP